MSMTVSVREALCIGCLSCCRVTVFYSVREVRNAPKEKRSGGGLCDNS